MASSSYSLWDKETLSEIESILTAADKRGYSRGVDAINRALDAAQGIARLRRELTDAPAGPQDPAPARTRAPRAQETSNAAQRLAAPPEGRRSGPGTPPPPSGEQRCNLSHPTKGPCMRSPHGGEGRCMYAGDKRLQRNGNADIVFSSAEPKKTTVRDIDGKALRAGSPVVFAGQSAALPAGWEGKVLEFSDDGKVLALGAHKKWRRGQQTEQMVDARELRHAGSA